MANEPAQVQEVLLRSGALLKLDLGPLIDEFERQHGSPLGKGVRHAMILLFPLTGATGRLPNPRCWAPSASAPQRAKTAPYPQITPIPWPGESDGKGISYPAPARRAAGRKAGPIRASGARSPLPALDARRPPRAWRHVC